MWTTHILTLFPNLFPGPLLESVVGRGLQQNLWQLHTHNIRDFSTERHYKVDDTPCGGGSGMVLKPNVLANAIRNTCNFNWPIIYLSPRGKLFNQNIARDLVQQYEGINLICGRFEGIDERVIEKFNIQEISIGDYVLSSGDLAAYVLIDACVRNIPGVLHCSESLQEESFGNSQEYRNLLEYPQYTRPINFEGVSVPNVLLTGNHKKIKEWRLKQAQVKTSQNRPDLWQNYTKDFKDY